ncbi:MAG TPA: tetratricopeptide repeat protein [Firmicutes bacterium]|nr:tetratricopeptide repeat protein [Bacillota bacterium]
MKKRTGKKLTLRDLKNNKILVLVIVILAVSGLLFSSLLYFFTPGLFGYPRNQATTNEEIIKQLEKQVRQYEKNLETAPDNEQLLIQLGDSYLNLGMIYSITSGYENKATSAFVKALEPYGKALEKNPDNVDLRVDRAVAAFYGNKLTEAEAEFKKAIETDPAHARAHYNYGIFLYYGRGKTAEAVKEWEEVVALNPAGEEKMVEQARLLLEEAAQDETETGTEEDPAEDNPPADGQ